jgi:hypothetical protein
LAAFTLKGVLYPCDILLLSLNYTFHLTVVPTLLWFLLYITLLTGFHQILLKLSMSGWTTDMAAALPDSNNTPPPAKVTAPAGALPSMTPQEHGWGPKVEYRYEAYNKSSKDHQATLFTDGDEATEDIGVGGIARGDWASNAQVYEWDQDYGDVGPEHPELEKQLFGGENHVRSGVSFEK